MDTLASSIQLHRCSTVATCHQEHRTRKAVEYTNSEGVCAALLGVMLALLLICNVITELDFPKYNRTYAKCANRQSLLFPN